jgi:hypothetical protein
VQRQEGQRSSQQWQREVHRVLSVAASVWVLDFVRSWWTGLAVRETVRESEKERSVRAVPSIHPTPLRVPPASPSPLRLFLFVALLAASTPLLSVAQFSPVQCAVTSGGSFVAPRRSKAQASATHTGKDSTPSLLPPSPCSCTRLFRMPEHVRSACCTMGIGRKTGHRKRGNPPTRQRTEGATGRDGTHTNRCPIGSPTQRCRREACTSIPYGVRRRTARTKICAVPKAVARRRPWLHGDEWHTAGCASLRAVGGALWRPWRCCGGKLQAKQCVLPKLFGLSFCPPLVHGANLRGMTLQRRRQIE